MLSSSCAPGLPSKSATTSSLDNVEMFTPSTAKKQSPASVNVHEHESVCACVRAYACVYLCWCVFEQLLSQTEATKLRGTARLYVDDLERTA